MHPKQTASCTDRALCSFHPHQTVDDDRLNLVCNSRAEHVFSRATVSWSTLKSPNGCPINQEFERGDRGTPNSWFSLNTAWLCSFFFASEKREKNHMQKVKIRQGCLCVEEAMIIMSRSSSTFSFLLCEERHEWWGSKGPWSPGNWCLWVLEWLTREIPQRKEERSEHLLTAPFVCTERCWWHVQ